jgi:hypothetical protein
MDAAWFEKVRALKPDNCTIFHHSDGAMYAQQILEVSETFDCIVIDGAERCACAANALQALAPGGMIILDNADWYPKTARLLIQSGFLPVAFNGFAPLNAFTHTTMIFISRDFAIPFKQYSQSTPVGGVKLPQPAFDDCIA